MASFTTNIPTTKLVPTTAAKILSIASKSDYVSNEAIDGLSNVLVLSKKKIKKTKKARKNQNKKNFVNMSTQLSAPVKQALNSFTDMIFKQVIQNDSATFVSELIKLGLGDFQTYATRIYPLSESKRNGPFGEWVFGGPTELQHAFVNVSLMTFLRPYALFLLRLAYCEIPSIKAEIDGLCVQDAPDFVLHSACFSLLGAQCFGHDSEGKNAAQLLAQMKQISFNMMIIAMVQNKWAEVWPHVRAKF
tara:strand:- start:126 stop:866 length:741 start_codon:yes stop_codon:yes gene_type:complete